MKQLPFEKQLLYSCHSLSFAKFAVSSPPARLDSMELLDHVFVVRRRHAVVEGDGHGVGGAVGRGGQVVGAQAEAVAAKADQKCMCQI